MSRAKLVLLGVAAGVLLIVAFVGGIQCSRACAPAPEVPIAVGIDAGPGEAEIAARLEAERTKAAEQVAEIERRRAEEIRRLDETARAEYEEVREQGPEAVASWLDDWIKRRRGASAGGPIR